MFLEIFECKYGWYLYYLLAVAHVVMWRLLYENVNFVPVYVWAKLKTKSVFQKISEDSLFIENKIKVHADTSFYGWDYFYINYVIKNKVVLV